MSYSARFTYVADLLLTRRRTTMTAAGYPSKILGRLGLLLFLLVCIAIGRSPPTVSGAAGGGGETVETIETIVYKDSSGVEHEEYAFRAPMRTAPEQVMKLFCANIKVRLYWNVFRDQVKANNRKGLHLRRLARFARHLYEEIRFVDRPFEGPMLSIVDEYFPAYKEKNKNKNPDSLLEDEAGSPKKAKGLKNLKNKLNWSKKAKKGSNNDESTAVETDNDNEDNRATSLSDDLDDLESSEIYNELKSQGLIDKMKKIKSLAKKYSPKIPIGLYTRWRTMWWLAMPCIFTKYYLWDPALDKLTKLKRSLVMYPEFQLVRLQDIDCAPIKFFKRILDVCKIMNPLLNFSFGQLSLDKTTRFKSDTHSLHDIYTR